MACLVRETNKTINDLIWRHNKEIIHDIDSSVMSRRLLIFPLCKAASDNLTAKEPGILDLKSFKSAARFPWPKQNRSQYSYSLVNKLTDAIHKVYWAKTMFRDVT